MDDRTVIMTTRTGKLLELESFIKFYVPKNWRGPIHEFDFPPYLTEDEFNQILTGVIPDVPKFQKYYVKEAINKWLSEQKNDTNNRL